MEIFESRFLEKTFNFGMKKRYYLNEDMKNMASLCIQTYS